MLSQYTGEKLYFVHSYHAVIDDRCEDWLLATTCYGQEFVSAVEKGNITAFQFHPEKSGEVGLRMLRNFAEADNFARLAAERMGATPEVRSLRSRILRTRVEQEEAERSRRLAEGDDAAYQLANRLDTQAAYEEYLRSYPDGEYKEAANRRISYLTRRSSQTQAAPPSSPVPIPETPQASASGPRSGLCCRQGWCLSVSARYRHRSGNPRWQCRYGSSAPVFHHQG